MTRLMNPSGHAMFVHLTTKDFYIIELAVSLQKVTERRSAHALDVGAVSLNEL